MPWHWNSWAWGNRKAEGTWTTRNHTGPAGPSVSKLRSLKASKFRGKSESKRVEWSLKLKRLTSTLCIWYPPAQARVWVSPETPLTGWEDYCINLNGTSNSLREAPSRCIKYSDLEHCFYTQQQRLEGRPRADTEGWLDNLKQFLSQELYHPFLSALFDIPAEYWPERWSITQGGTGPRIPDRRSVS